MTPNKRSKKYIAEYRKLKKYLNHLSTDFNVLYDIFDDTIYIHGEKSEFYVSIKGGLCKHAYKFYHKNKLGDGYHLQGEYKLKFGLFMCFSHDYNIKYDIPRPSRDDYRQYCREYDILRKYQQSQSYRTYRK